MEGGRQANFLFLPDGEDPDSLVQKQGADALRERVNGAIPLPDFLFDTLLKQTDLERMDGRARLADLARPVGKLQTLSILLGDSLVRELGIDVVAEQSVFKKYELHMSFQTYTAPRCTRFLRSLFGQPPQPLDVITQFLILNLQCVSLDRR